MINNKIIYNENPIKLIQTKNLKHWIKFFSPIKTTMCMKNQGTEKIKCSRLKPFWWIMALYQLTKNKTIKCKFCRFQRQEILLLKPTSKDLKANRLISSILAKQLLFSKPTKKVSKFRLKETYQRNLFLVIKKSSIRKPTSNLIWNPLMKLLIQIMMRITNTLAIRHLFLKEK
jgi:hypothetical protein